MEATMTKEDILAYEQVVVGLIDDIKYAFSNNASPEKALEGLEREIYDRMSAKSQKEFDGIIRHVFDVQARGVDAAHDEQTITRVAQFCEGEYLDKSDQIMREAIAIAKAMQKMEETPMSSIPKNQLC